MDNSRTIASSYSERYDNILLIDQSNQGLGAARNTGLKYASGEYILFVDSDDYISKDSVCTLVKAAEENDLDIVQAGFIKVTEDGKIINTVVGKNTNKVSSGKEWLREGNIIYGACFCLYRRDFIENNKLSFVPGVYHEDMDFTLHATYLAERIMSIDFPFYNYLYRETSITGDKSFKRCLDYYKVSEVVSEWVDKEVDKETYDKFFREYLSFMYSHCVNLCIIQGIPIVRMLEDEERYKHILDHLKLSSSKKYKIEYLLLKHKLYKVYEKLYLLTKGR